MTPEQQTTALLKCQDAIERLENANMAMRDAINVAASHLSAFLGFYSDSLSLSQMRSLSECINKLQPFITQPK